MIATMSGDVKRSYGLFLGLAERRGGRVRRCATRCVFLGLIDLQDTVIGRKARNTGHKAIRARAVTDLADYIGWERVARRLLHGRAGHGDRAALLLAVRRRLRDGSPPSFPDAGKNLKQTNQTPLSPARGRGDDPAADGGRSAQTVWDLITAHLRDGKSITQPRRRDPARRRRADPAHHDAAPVHRGPASVRLLQCREQLDAHDGQSVPAAHPVSDGQLHQRRGAREQAVQFGDRAGVRRVRSRRP